MAFGHTRGLQRQIYEFIVGFIETEGRPPTIREIGRALGIASTSHVTHYLRMLEKEGSIRREPKKSRGIKLTAPSEGIPVIGAIAAGSPLDIFPGPANRIAVDHILGDKNAFALVVRGNSMIEDYICDGDYVIITPEFVYYDEEGEPGEEDIG
jgi:repressor LexA